MDLVPRTAPHRRASHARVPILVLLSYAAMVGNIGDLRRFSRATLLQLETPNHLIKRSSRRLAGLLPSFLTIKILPVIASRALACRG